MSHTVSYRGKKVSYGNPEECYWELIGYLGIASLMVSENTEPEDLAYMAVQLYYESKLSTGDSSFAKENIIALRIRHDDYNN